MNVVRQTVSKWERGLSVPDSDMLVSLSDALDAPVATLLGEAVNLQLARRRQLKRKVLCGVLVAACAARGMRHNKALKAVARKRLKVIYSIMKKPRPYEGRPAAKGRRPQGLEACPPRRAGHTAPTRPPRSKTLDTDYGDPPTPPWSILSPQSYTVDLVGPNSCYRMVMVAPSAYLSAKRCLNSAV